jgi:hypothetical protein
VDRRAQICWGPRIRGVDLALPVSWRISYYDGSNWRPVETGDPYTLRLDLPNEVRFKPVTTTALRLEVEFAAAPCTVQEWRVNKDSAGKLSFSHRLPRRIGVAHRSWPIDPFRVFGWKIDNGKLTAPKSDVKSTS